MTSRLLASALFAGLAAGLASAALQQWFTVPVIEVAELYESGEMTHDFGQAAAGAHDHGDGHTHADGAADGHSHAADAADGHSHAATADDGHSHAAGADAGHSHAADAQGHSHGDGPEGLMRTGLTALTTVLAMVGFGLLLTAGFSLAERLTGARIDLRAGLAWGAAGFAATQLATAVGLPPELPGSAAAELGARQTWWVMAALGTAAGIAVLAYVPGPARWAGLVLIAAPHLVGAPHPDQMWGVVPPELAGIFAARVLAVGAVGWLVLGGVAGHLWSRARPA
ncbi:CbtA family protein [Albimonas pacifica]|uniref:Cobalt transporter subunit CbtA n=1 Tax=Albimonas pacifica TaxID=1114924 RepID=A0A1I3EEI8_9RHOB|nr:CbtA family protein [Albimonas pacifica]SFH97316.1 cobalt transporter subunit CbtA [Albimonas pacifica]